MSVKRNPIEVKGIKLMLHFRISIWCFPYWRVNCKRSAFHVMWEPKQTLVISSWRKYDSEF